MQNTAGPTLLKSPDLQQTASQIANNPKGWFKRNMILAVVLLAVAGAVAFGAVSYFSPQSARNINILSPKVNEMTSASLSLLPDKNSYKKGENVVIDVKLFTGGQMTHSVDLVVKYDPAFLQPQVDNFVSVGQIYPEYPAAQADDKLGLIGVSGIIMESGQGFSGIGNFARLNFVALKEGRTNVMIDYQKDQTFESNVVLAGGAVDILGFTDDAEIVISDTGSGTAESLPESCGSFTQYCQDVSGKVGTQVCNAGTINGEVCGYNSRLTTSCEVCKI